jgi:hypothetical protein
MLQIKSQRPDAKETHSSYVTETDTFHFFGTELPNKAQQLTTSGKDGVQMVTYLNISIC